MDATAIIELIKVYGWQAAVIAFAAFFLIECFKPLIRKVISNEQGRHAFYSIFDALLVGIGSYAAVALTMSTWGIDWAVFGSMFAAGYGCLKVIYPIYSNLGIQKGLKSLFSAIFKSRKEITEAAKGNSTTDKKADKDKVITL